MQLYGMTVGPLQENTYLLSNDQQETLIFDPGDQADAIGEVIETKGLRPIAILLTHAHSDHIGAVEELRNYYQIPVYVNRVEAAFLTDPKQNLSLLYGTPIICKPADDFYPAEGGIWQIGTFQPRLVTIPGHSPGSTVFIFEEEGFVIGGDVLFKGSIGRYDFPLGGRDQLVSGIKDHLLILPPDTVVFPGHGEATTIGDELVHNPFL